MLRNLWMAPPDVKALAGVTCSCDLCVLLHVSQEVSVTVRGQSVCPLPFQLWHLQGFAPLLSLITAEAPAGPGHTFSVGPTHSAALSGFAEPPGSLSAVFFLVTIWVPDDGSPRCAGLRFFIS